MYLATDLEMREKKLDFDEETEVVEISLAEGWEMVMDGRIQDAKTIAGLGLIQAHLQQST